MRKRHVVDVPFSHRYHVISLKTMWTYDKYDMSSTVTSPSLPVKRLIKQSKAREYAEPWDFCRDGTLHFAGRTSRIKNESYK